MSSVDRRSKKRSTKKVKNKRRCAEPVEVLLNPREAEAYAEAPGTRAGDAPVANLQVAGRIAPAAAPYHAARPARNKTPLPDITTHVVEIESVFGFLPNLFCCGCITIWFCYAIAVPGKGIKMRIIISNWYPSN